MSDDTMEMNTIFIIIYSCSRDLFNLVVITIFLLLMLVLFNSVWGLDYYYNNIIIHSCLIACTYQ